MKRYILRITVILSAFALIGLIVIQTYWVTESIKLSKKHYEHRAYVALKSTIEEIKRDVTPNLIQKAEKNSSLPILQIVPPNVLDSLLLKYISFYQIDTVYEFAIVHSSNNKIIYASSNYKQCKSIKVINRHCLSCIYDKEHYHVELYFPHRLKNVWLNVAGWLALSVMFVIIIISCFGFIILSVFRHKKLSEMKSDFINNISHEFKTPISTISLASEILINSNADTGREKIERYARIIFDENNRMRAQVEQVLRMTLLEKGEIILNKEVINANDLIQASVQNLCLEHNYQNIQINFNLNASSPLISADPIHFTNIIYNLVENACKYSMDNKAITISSQSNNQTFTFSIRDNGIGIAAHKQKLIFDKFYRVPTGYLHNVKGFGIGLYYVKNMVEAHSGIIWVESEIGKGSEFFVELPVIIT